jgi:Ca2+-binding EF-hand superfamily protein
VRLVAQARSLWLLVRGMAGSLLTMFYTFIIIFVALYAFACAVLELISRDHQLRAEDPEYEQLVQTYFPDLFTTLITLIQFVTLDSINTIYIPFIMKKPVTCGSLFFLLIMLVSVALMNLVTAVIVEGAIAQANSERDVLKAYKASAVKSMLPRLGSLFHQLDPDGNGKITFDEILEASSELKDELASIVQAEDFVEIFQLLDDDRSGSLDIDEFIQSVTQITSSDLPIESVRMMKQISLCREDLAELRSGLKELIDQRLPIPLIQPSLLPAPPLDSLVADVGLRTRL